MDWSKIRYSDLAFSFSKIMQMINFRINEHDVQVSYIASEFARELELEDKQIAQVAFAGIIHDVGILYEIDNCGNFNEDDKHSYRGYIFLNYCDRIPDFLSKVILYHHESDYDIIFNKTKSHEIALGASIIYIAGKIALFLENEGIRKTRDWLISLDCHPSLKEVINKILYRDRFWENINNEKKYKIIANALDSQGYLNYERILCIVKSIIRVIEFRSPTTFFHSVCTAKTASLLSEYYFKDLEKVKIMNIAGYLHDVGKINIPLKILESEGNLSPEEFKIMKKHAEYTYEILKDIKNFEYIARLASSHHERLLGSGYPNCLKGEEITKEISILAVSDIFTSLNEKRSYRDRLHSEEIKQIFHDLVKKKELDYEIVNLLFENYKNIRYEIDILYKKEQLDYETLLRLI